MESSQISFSSPQETPISPFLSEDLDFSCFSEDFELYPIEIPERALPLQKTSKKIAKTPKPSDLSPKETKPKAARNPWKPHEDKLVLELFQQFGPRWTLIGQFIGGRKCKQVRDRYLNQLRPHIKNGPFSHEEDELLKALHYELGTKWSVISERMEGRTESQVKNRFNMALRHIIPKRVGKEEESVCSQSTGESAAGEEEVVRNLTEL